MNQAGARKQMQNAFAKVGIGTAKGIAARDFQKLVRLEEADANGICQCVTCGKRDHWKNMQAGHFIPGRTNSLIFDRRGCHTQDIRCNHYLSGNPVKYREWMLENYGQAVIDDLERLKSVPRTFTKDELIEMRLEWRASIRVLEAKLNN